VSYSRIQNNVRSQNAFTVSRNRILIDIGVEEWVPSEDRTGFGSRCPNFMFKAVGFLNYDWTWEER
jgi:hypothetical protein